MSDDQLHGTESSNAPKDYDHVHPAFNRKGKEHKALTLKELLDAPRSPIFEVRLRQSEIIRQAGNDAYKRGLVSESIQLYERALYHADFEEAQLSFEFKPEHRKNIASTLQPIYLNLARCALHEKRNRDVTRFTSKAIESAVAEGDEKPFIPDDVRHKAHFLNGKAYIQMGDHETAEEELQKCLGFDPTDTAVQRLIRENKLTRLADKKKSAEVWKKALVDPNAVREIKPTSKIGLHVWIAMSGIAIVIACLMCLFFFV